MKVPVYYNFIFCFFSFFLISCSEEAGEGFNDEKLFANYVHNLNLSGQNFDKAWERLKAEGFICSKDANIIDCQRGAAIGWVCGETQVISLTPSASNTINITTHLKHVCL